MPRRLTDKEGEVRELTAADLRRFRKAADVLSPSLLENLERRKRGPQKRPTKERITIRLSREVVECFRATGHGWQARLDAALKEWLSQRPAPRL